MGNRENKGVVTCVWRPKSKLERYLIIALIILIVLFIALLLFVIIKPSITKRKCATTACLTAASKIMNRLDVQVDPCENFYKFACGNYRLGAKTLIEILQEDVYKQALDIVNETIKETDHYLLQTQKDLYQKCLNQTVAEENALEVINSTITELQWPVVFEHTWKEHVFDWQDLMFKLRRKGYPFEMFLDVRAIPINSTYILQVSYSSKTKIGGENTDLTRTYMTEVAAIFGAQHRYAAIEMEKVLDFSQGLDKVTEDYDTHTFTIRQYQEENPEIDWLNFINTILYPVNHLSIDDTVEFPEIIDKFFKLIYRTPKRVIANYMIWKVVENFIPFMPKKVRALQERYQCQTGEFTKNNRIDLCKNIFDNFFPVPSHIAFVKKYLPKPKLEKVKTLIKNIKKQFREFLNKAPWLDEISKLNSLEKLDNSLAVIGAPYDYFDDSHLDQFVWPGQRNKIPNRENFFQNLLEVKHMHQNNIFYKIYQKERYRFDMIYDVLQDVNAQHLYSSNLIILSVGILQNIFYDENAPMYLNYGSLGSMIGHEFTHGFSDEGSEYNKHGDSERIWSNVTNQAHAEALKCIIEDVNTFNENSSEVLNATKTLEENYADYIGIRTAYSAYQSWVENNGEEDDLVGVPYTTRQLFWIPSVTFNCFAKPTSKMDLHADGMFRTNFPIRNTEDFAKDFNCPINSHMNPSKKCRVY